jgi:nitroimidazol reductase NimA-like FMN-containing flavoprotein (pyridoxamine 5'-phosphate oxidase superfamily)
MQNGRPHVMPVWFVLDGEQLVFTTGAVSVKGRNLRRDPRIALLVDDDPALRLRARARMRHDPRGFR